MTSPGEAALQRAKIALDEVIIAAGGGLPPFTLNCDGSEAWYTEACQHIDELDGKPDPWLRTLMEAAGKAAEALDEHKVLATLDREGQILLSSLAAFGEAARVKLRSIELPVARARDLQTMLFETWQACRKVRDRLAAHLVGVPVVALIEEFKRGRHWYCRVTVDGKEEEITAQLAEGLLAINEAGRVVEYPIRQLQSDASRDKPWIESVFRHVASSTRNSVYADYECAEFQGTLLDHRPHEGCRCQPYVRKKSS